MKNRILYVLFMVLIIPFFVLITLSMKKDQSGEVVYLNSFYSFDIVKEDGVVEPGDKTFEFFVPEDTNVLLTRSWDVEEPGFITCFTINDAEGNSVYNDAGFQMQETKNSLYLEAGSYRAGFYFLANEAEFRRFCEKTEMFAVESAMNAFIEQIGFDTFDSDSTPTMQLYIDIEGVGEAPLWMRVLSVILGIFEVILLIMIMIGDKTPDITLKDRLSKIGIRYAVLGLVVTLTQVVLAYLVGSFSSSMSDAEKTNLSFLVIIISVDLIGFPLLYLLCKKIPANKLQKRRVGFGTYLAYMVMSVGLVLAGSMIGMLFHLMFSGNGASDSTTIADLLYNSNPLPRILTIGILAPIFEELIFRKILIDRLHKFGALVSVLASGLFFGLFHGNFQQFFFAAFLGCLWGILYLKSGNVKLTIGLHMMINLGTSVITTTLMTRSLGQGMDFGNAAEMIAASGGPNIYMILLLLWIIFILLTGIAGVVVFIVFAVTGRLVPDMPEGTEESKGSAKVFFGSAYVWAFFAVCIGLFVMSYI